MRRALLLLQNPFSTDLQVDLAVEKSTLSLRWRNPRVYPVRKWPCLSPCVWRLYSLFVAFALLVYSSLAPCVWLIAPFERSTLSLRWRSPRVYPVRNWPYLSPLRSLCAAFALFICGCRALCVADRSFRALDPRPAVAEPARVPGTSAAPALFLCVGREPCLTPFGRARVHLSYNPGRAYTTDI